MFGDNGLIKKAEYARDLSSNSTEAEFEGMNSLFGEFTNMMIEDSKVPEVTVPSTIEEAKGSGDTFKGTTTIKDDLNNDVTIPGGFKIASDSGTKIEEGIVIEDNAGNQFVWIPVGTYQTSSGQKINNLSRRRFTSSEATEINGDDVLDEYFYGEGNENSVAKDQIGAFKTSATTHGGFYIGRYEAGTEISRTSSSDALNTPLVQANKNAYVYVTRDQAKAQSEAMYNGNSYVTSELVSSYAWDTALNFICQTNTEAYLLSKTKDSAYGNLGTNTLELTGAYETDNYSNIYDFLGNCREWSTEYTNYSNGPCVDRGGYYELDSGTASIRGSNPTNEKSSDSNTAFRLQLYIK